MELFGGATLLRLGGHFPGSAVLHWAPGANGRGLLCSGAPWLCFQSQQSRQGAHATAYA